MSNILTIQNLTKQYGNRVVLNNLSLEIEKGSVYGLLGPNGSGKTTTLSILLDIIPQNAGTYEWFGESNNHQARKRIGSLLETPNFYSYLSAERNLMIAADIKEIPYSDIERVLKFVSLYDRRKDKFKTFSLGMKQRLAIASALLGNPEILVLDEPTNGLDPKGIYEIRELIFNISNQGITIIIASHILDEIEKVCTEVAIIKDGNLVIKGKVSEILGSERILEVGAANLAALHEALKQLPGIKAIKKELNVLALTLADEANAEDINKILMDKGIIVSHLAYRKKNLEMQFLELTN
jgi:ABC-type multidrug transport system ATPase subunit